jgi:histidine phosphotransfer protein HptB
VRMFADVDVDWTIFSRARTELGAGFVRFFGYFREDGDKSITCIEEAVRHGEAAKLVLPADKLKNEAREFGAMELAALAEHIEMQARDCIEWHQDPAALVEHIVKLRPLFESTIEALDAASNPLKQRRVSDPFKSAA